MPSLDVKKQHRKKQRVADSDESDDDIGAQGGRNDLILAKVESQYLNQPIDLKQGEAKLRVLAANLTVIKKRVADTVGTLIDAAGEMADSLSEDHRDEEYDEDRMLAALKNDATMSQLDKDFRDALDREAELAIRAATISDMRGRISQGHQVTDIFKVYEQRVQPPLEEFRQKTPRQKYEKHEDYNQYRSHVWESFTDGKGVPNIKKFLPREDGDEESEDEDVEFGAQTHNFMCPITLMTFEDPYTSTVCPHSFSGAAIKEMIKAEHGRTKCPVPGCAQSLELGTVVADAGLKRRTEAHVRRAKEGRTQGATQGRQYAQMNLDSEDEAEEEAAAEEVKRVKKEKGRGGA
ncbi:hypothetical protein JCM10450v2_003162 [Rhodotorula kratochvilovae]